MKFTFESVFCSNCNETQQNRAVSQENCVRYLMMRQHTTHSMQQTRVFLPSDDPATQNVVPSPSFLICLLVYTWPNSFNVFYLKSSANNAVS
jgi:hypothetical protein